MEKVNEWKEFCEGGESFDKAHFYTLFWEGITRSDLDTIFKYFPKSLEAVTNGIPTNETLLNLVVRDINEKKSIISSDSHLFAIVQELKVEFVEDFENVSRLRHEPSYIEFFDAINDALSDSWIIEDKKAFALYEAFYGLTNDYEMVWYLFSPLFRIENADFSSYYKLKVLGGMYALTSSQILVSRNYSGTA